MKPMEIKMVFEKETKNTYRYEEVQEKSEAPIIKYLYIQKYAFKEKPPTEITVTIS